MKRINFMALCKGASFKLVGVMACCGVMTAGLSACGESLNEVCGSDGGDEWVDGALSRSILFSTGMSVGVTPWHNGNEVRSLSRGASLSECASVIHFYDFVDGAVAQSKLEKTSGTFSVKLPFGVHDLRFLAHSSDDAAPTEDGKLFAPSNVTETFLCNESLTVNADTPNEQTVKMSRVVGKVAVKITDAVPKGVTALKLSLGSHCAVLDLATGKGVQKECRPTSKEWNVGNTIEGRVGQVVGLLTFVPAGGMTTSVRIEGKDAEGKVLYVQEASSVPVEANRVTTASCKLFKREGDFTFTIDTDWEPGIDVDMEETKK